LATVNITNLLASPQTYTYTNNLNYSIKATPTDTGPDVLAQNSTLEAAARQDHQYSWPCGNYPPGHRDQRAVRVLVAQGGRPQSYYDWSGEQRRGGGGGLEHRHGMDLPPGIYFFNTNGNVTGSLESWRITTSGGYP